MKNLDRHESLINLNVSARIWHLPCKYILYYCSSKVKFILEKLNMGFAYFMRKKKKKSFRTKKILLNLARNLSSSKTS